MEHKQHEVQTVKKPDKGETISELARRHMLNKDHMTTDEELKNARIEFNEYPDASVSELSRLSEVDHETVFPPLPFEKNIMQEDKEISDSDSKNPSIPNPYDVLK
jgi:hypothetical protein